MENEKIYTQEQLSWLADKANEQEISLAANPSERRDHLLDLVNQGILKLYGED